ncbi:MAG TPA: HXXEE domain-containing protein [Longimicrobiales bacterium]|nr:HXXEE domain-containing protein [Longimicrobiales bacterium]
MRGRVSPRADLPSDFALIDARFKTAFGALIVIQAAHSIEEYVGRLWESFPPAAFVSGLVSADPQFGFLVANCALVAFGIWCFWWPVRRNWRSGTWFAAFWIGIEVINGVGHPAWALRQRGYTPGVATAPLLLVLALYLATLRRSLAGTRMLSS